MSGVIKAYKTIKSYSIHTALATKIDEIALKRKMETKTNFTSSKFLEEIIEYYFKHNPIKP
jgi:hypothetical protein